ncbi:MAG: hypothetical protein Q8N36_00725 [bacterium]|nr:hypothetical protein [bacterium]
MANLQAQAKRTVPGALNRMKAEATTELRVGNAAFCGYLMMSIGKEQD